MHLVLERGETVGLAIHTALISGSGVEYQIADTAAPIRDASGSITGVVLVFSDVTAQYRTQQALKDSERRFRTIFEAGPQCIKILDGQGRFVDVNAAGLVVFEAESTPDLQQHLLLDLVLPEYRDALSALLRRVLTGENGVLEFEITGLKGTQRWLEGHAATLRDALGNVTVLVIAGDVTRRKKAQAERRALEAQLRESQKMEAMGTLAGGIAHDFNNILGAILGNTALARQDIREDHPAWQSLEQINRAGLRARELVRQILAFSRRQPHNLVTQPIQPLVVETLALLRATLPAMVKLDTEIAQEALHVHADTTQIEQVIMNLCTNAWHALQGSTGHIVVGIGPAVLDDAAARTLRAAAPGPYVHLWVSDNGSGMDAATQARIFEPFFTTKPTGQGTGLGLSVVHGIVGAHRGAIAVESSPGKGSTFHVYLPLVDGIDFAPSIAVELKASAGRGQHVAYVDDDEVMVLMVERILQRQGYRVTGFLDAKMAIAAVRAQPDGFDLIVTDFNMPEISGLDVASEMGSIRADLPVVISSGYISDELRAGAHRLGVRALLQKQNTSEELGALVYSILVTHGS